MKFADSERLAEETTLRSDSDSGEEPVQTQESTKESCTENAPTDETTNNHKKQVLESYPDIALSSLPPNKSSVKTGGKTNPTRHSTLLRALCICATLACVTALASKSFSDRSASENLFRKFVDEARVAELKQKYDVASAAWQKAIEQATILGDGQDQLGELCINLAEVDYKLIPAPSKTFFDSAQARAFRGDIENAVAYYKQVQGSELKQITAWNHLISYYTEEATTVRVDEFSNTQLSGHDLNYLGAADREAFKFIERELVEQGSGKFSSLVHYSAPTLEVISDLNAKLKGADRRLIALNQALMFLNYGDDYSICAAYEKGDKLRKESFKRAHLNPDSYEDNKSIADEQFKLGQYMAAMIGYSRCQGMHQDAAVEKKLQSCYVKMHLGNLEAARAAIELLKEQRRLMTVVFGEKSREVTSLQKDVALMLSATGQIERAEALQQEILRRTLADPFAEPDYTTQNGTYSTNPEEKAYCELMEFYVAEGKFKQGKELFISAVDQLNSRYPHRTHWELTKTYTNLCARAGWLDDPATLSFIKSKQSYKSAKNSYSEKTSSQLQ